MLHKGEELETGEGRASTFHVVSFAVSPFVSRCHRRLRAVSASVLVTVSERAPMLYLKGGGGSSHYWWCICYARLSPGWFPAAPWCAGSPCGTAPALLAPAGAPKFSGRSWSRCLGRPCPCPTPSPLCCLLPYALLARPDLGSRGWVGANTIRLGISHWLENCLSA